MPEPIVDPVEPVVDALPPPPVELFDRPQMLGNNTIPEMLTLAPSKRILNPELARCLTVMHTSNLLFKSVALTELMFQIENAWASINETSTRQDAIAMATAQAGNNRNAASMPTSIIQNTLSGKK